MRSVSIGGRTCPQPSKTPLPSPWRTNWSSVNQWWGESRTYCANLHRMCMLLRESFHQWVAKRLVPWQNSSSCPLCLCFLITSATLRCERCAIKSCPDSRGQGSLPHGLLQYYYHSHPVVAHFPQSLFVNCTSILLPLRFHQLTQMSA